MNRGRPKTPGILTPREWEVLDLLRRGLSNREIADHLDISLAGAKFHVSEIITKLGVESREEAAAWRGEKRPLLAFMPLGKWKGLPKQAITLGVFAAAAMAIVAVAIALGASRGAGTQSPEQSLLSETPPAASNEAALTGLMARLTRIEGDVLTLVDGEGEHAVVVSNDTSIWRDHEHVYARGKGVEQVRIGDSLSVAGLRLPDGAIDAREIDVNVFMTRDGYITAIGSDYMDVSVRVDKYSSAFADVPTRFYIDPWARIGIAPDGSAPVLKFGELTVGQHVALQGYIGDDGAMVARFIYYEAY